MPQQLGELPAAVSLVSFFFNDTATTEIYPLSLHDALPISLAGPRVVAASAAEDGSRGPHDGSEEHTSELQSPMYLVCRLLLEKKKYNEDQTLCQNTRIYFLGRVLDSLFL